MGIGTRMPPIDTMSPPGCAPGLGSAFSAGRARFLLPLCLLLLAAWESNSADAGQAVSTGASPATATVANAATQPAAGKLLLDGTNYVNKPAKLMTTRGTPFTKVVVNGYWITHIVEFNGPRELAVKPTQTIQESGTRYLAHWAKEKGADYLVVDLEGPQLTPANCEKMLGWLRAEMVANLKISFYEVPPAVGPVPNSPAALQWQHADNLKWANFAAKLDFLTPSLYSGPSVNRPADMDHWVAALKWSVAECRSIAPGVPVLPFLCPRFVDYPSFPKALQWTMIPTAALSREIAETLKVADGYVIWDPAFTPPNQEPHVDDWAVAARTWWPAVQQN
jgi:hypothetical protein